MLQSGENHTILNGETDKDVQLQVDESKKRKHEQTLGRDDHHENEDEEDKANKIALKKLRKEKLAQVKEELAKLKGQTAATGSVSAVFVSQLPKSITKEELLELFGKYGVISEDFLTHEKRIKLYNDSTGTFKGEAVVFYHNYESVELAIEMLDGTKVGDATIKVEPAKFEQKQSNHGEKKQLTQEQRRLLQEKKKSLSRKLTDWDDDGKVPIVVVKNMFRPAEFALDKSLQLDIQLDIEDECRKLGIDKDISTISFDESGGNVRIEFKLSQLSKLCINNFNGRYFDGLKISASLK